MSQETDFDFDAWASLARDDPEAFERLRERAIEEIIATAPETMRRRLRGLQWRVDHVRRRAGSPLGACIRMSEMMWKAVLGPDGLRDSLNALGGASTAHVRERRSAAILRFDRDRTPEE